MREGFIGIQVRGIEPEGVVGRFERRDAAIFVAGIARLHVGTDARFYNVFALFPQLFNPALNAGFEVRLDQASDLGRAYGAAYQRMANNPYFNLTSTAAAP